MEQLNKRIYEIKEQLAQKRKWQRQLKDYEAELKEKQKSVSQLKRQLLKEEADVEKLTGLSFDSLLTTILGKKAERLDQEKQEVVLAQLNYTEAAIAAEEIENEVNQLRDKLSRLASTEETYKNLLAEKEHLIQDINSPLTAELFAISEQSAELQALSTEVNEASTAGKQAKTALENADTSLGKAKNWGTFDLLGGGLISTAIKHSHIDEAKQAIRAAQTKMRSFQKELIDIDEELNVNLDISSFLTFADFFFDDFFSELLVQGKINNSIEMVSDHLANVNELLAKLSAMQVKLAEDLEQLADKRVELLEQ